MYTAKAEEEQHTYNYDCHQWIWKILYELNKRDKRDRDRAVSPLKIADDAYIIDNSNQTPDETVQEILEYIKNNKQK